MSISEEFEKLPREFFPNHIAIIPNGNRTWAKQKVLSGQEGHKIGVEVLINFARKMR